MLQLGRNQREWERENLENECGSQKSVRGVRESKIGQRESSLRLVRCGLEKSRVFGGKVGSCCVNCREEATCCWNAGNFKQNREAVKKKFVSQENCVSVRGTDYP